MTMNPVYLFSIFTLFFPLTGLCSVADELIQKAETHLRGKSFQAEAQMTVKNSGTQRTLEMQIWAEGQNKAVVKISKPSKDRNTGNLRIDFNLWQYLPNIDRIVKIPSSLMLQSWMGSDFTNDDLVRTSSLVRDYSHKLLGYETLSGVKLARIECTPHKDAPVVWGKIISWVGAQDGVPHQQEFYSETGEKLKIMTGTDIKTFGSHTIPTFLSMKTIKKGTMTTLRYSQVKFDEAISDRIFRQEFLRESLRD